MEKRVIYLDNNATTRTAPEVVETMLPYFGELYGNPSSIHHFGGSVAPALEHARRQAAELIGAAFRDRDNIATEVIFTSCGTESDNAAIAAALNAKAPRNKIITSCVEHPAILECLKMHERRGVEVVRLPVDANGQISLKELERTADENTALVTLMWANNETGTIFPIAEAAEIAHQCGAFFHTDAVQAAGKVPIDVEALGIDFLSLSGHKLHAPKGVGILYVRRGIRFSPFILGGHQERMRRGGTENVASIVGLGKACELAKAGLEEEIRELSKLRDHLEELIASRIPCVRFNGDKAHRLPNTSSVSFEYIEGESILMMLDMHGICASSGSACTTGSLEPSHVLRAMGLPYTAAHGTIRFSLSRYNTVQEIEDTVEKLVPIIAALRKISPYWNNGEVKS